MADYLTRRNGFWQYVRKVPLRYRHLDKRGIIKLSTQVAVAKDRNGRLAKRVADTINADLEAFWRGLESGNAEAAQITFAEARTKAKMYGIQYLEMDALTQGMPIDMVRRIEKLAVDGLVDDGRSIATFLGGAQKNTILISELWKTFEDLSRSAIVDMSPNQLRIWKNGRILAAKNLISVIGDKRLDEITNEDVLDYNEWWQGRVVENEVAVKTANKDIGYLSRMIKVVNKKHRYGLSDIFAGMRLEGGINASRLPFETAFIQRKIINSGVLMGLNEEARRCVLLIADTGLRLSEAANLNEGTIHLDGDIPYVQVRPDGRRIKTEQSERDIPLVGVSLEAAKAQPRGFPRYADKGASLSAVVNKFLDDKKLRPTKKHSVYSLRHSFKDRLIAAKAPDSLIDSLMGHRGSAPKYGVGPQLDLKLEWLSQIAFIPSRFI